MRPCAALLGSMDVLVGCAQPRAVQPARQPACLHKLAHGPSNPPPQAARPTPPGNRSRLADDGGTRPRGSGASRRHQAQRPQGWRPFAGWAAEGGAGAARGWRPHVPGAAGGKDRRQAGMRPLRPACMQLCSAALALSHASDPAQSSCQQPLAPLPAVLGPSAGGHKAGRQRACDGVPARQGPQLWHAGASACADKGGRSAAVRRRCRGQWWQWRWELQRTRQRGEDRRHARRTGHTQARQRRQRWQRQQQRPGWLRRRLAAGQWPAGGSGRCGRWRRPEPGVRVRAQRRGGNREVSWRPR